MNPTPNTPTSRTVVSVKDNAALTLGHLEDLVTEAKARGCTREAKVQLQPKTRFLDQNAVTITQPLPELAEPEVPRRGPWLLMDRDWREVYVLETGHLAGTPDPLHLTTPLGANTEILDSVRYAYRVGVPDSAYIVESYQDRNTATARERVLVFRKLTELDAEVRRLAETF